VFRCVSVDVYVLVVGWRLARTVDLRHGFELWIWAVDNTMIMCDGWNGG